MLINRNLQILVVDDSMDARKIIKLWLMKAGFKHITEAENGQEGYDIVKKMHTLEKPIELIFADWKMPVMSGLEFFEAIHGEIEELGEIPFIMVTNQNSMPKVVEAVQAGVHNYVVKPFSGDDLKTKIIETMKRCHDQFQQKKIMI
jgi:two-component system, chemotaxis family, chemotaxis protein CheY